MKTDGLSQFVHESLRITHHELVLPLDVYLRETITAIVEDFSILRVTVQRFALHHDERDVLQAGIHE